MPEADGDRTGDRDAWHGDRVLHVALVPAVGEYRQLPARSEAGVQNVPRQQAAGRLELRPCPGARGRAQLLGLLANECGCRRPGLGPAGREPALELCLRECVDVPARTRRRGAR